MQGRPDIENQPSDNEAVANQSISSSAVMKIAGFALTVGAMVFAVMFMAADSEDSDKSKSLVLATAAGCFAALGTFCTTCSIVSRMNQSFRLFPSSESSTQEERRALTPSRPNADMPNLRK